MQSHQSSFAPSWRTVIGISDDHDLALRPLLAPDVYPEIETVVQVHVGEQR